MTYIPPNMRCGVCDRPHVDCHRTGDATCERNRVNWRERAIALEASAREVVPEVDALLHALGVLVAAKKTAKEASSAYSKAAMPMLNFSLKPKDEQKVINDVYWAARRASEAAEAEVLRAWDAMSTAYDAASAKNGEIPETPHERVTHGHSYRGRGYGYAGNE